MKEVPCTRCGVTVRATDDAVNVLCDDCWSLREKTRVFQEIMQGKYDHTIPGLKDELVAIAYINGAPASSWEQVVEHLLGDGIQVLVSNRLYDLTLEEEDEE